jgi:hypothetical protein
LIRQQRIPFHRSTKPRVLPSTVITLSALWKKKLPLALSPLALGANYDLALGANCAECVLHVHVLEEKVWRLYSILPICWRRIAIWKAPPPSVLGNRPNTSIPTHSGYGTGSGSSDGCSWSAL